MNFKKLKLTGLGAILTTALVIGGCSRPSPKKFTLTFPNGDYRYCEGRIKSGKISLYDGGGDRLIIRKNFKNKKSFYEVFNEKGDKFTGDLLTKKKIKKNMQISSDEASKLYKEFRHCERILKHYRKRFYSNK